MSWLGTLGPHADFIIAAYAVTLVIVAMLIVWIATDYAIQRRKVRNLESEGISRRSAQAKPQP